jgi:hypothetical protein
MRDQRDCVGAACSELEKRHVANIAHIPANTFMISFPCSASIIWNVSVPIAARTPAPFRTSESDQE